MKKFLKLMLGIALVVLSSCSSGFDKGERVYVSQRCFAAINEIAYKVMTDFCVERNESAIKSMISDGEVYILQSGTSGKVTDYNKGAYEVDFDGYGTLWIASDNLKD